MSVFSLRRRRLLHGLLACTLLPFAGTALASGPADKLAMELWKGPRCGCCTDWIAHVEEHGYTITAHDSGNQLAREKLGMPHRYGSCHTAVVDGYVIEGHVPAADIQRLLRERPDAIGLAAPGMPLGSPGMDGPEYGGRKDAYDVLLVGRDGSATVFQRH